MPPDFDAWARKFVKPMRTTIVAITLSLLSLTCAAAVEHHLVPRWPQTELPNYYTLLQKKVMVTPADCGRFIVIPSPASFGEESVAVWSAGSHFRVTHTKASRNIWYATIWPKDPDYGIDRHGAVAVSRVDTELPAPTALAVQRAWARMLRETAPRQRRDAEPVILDGTEYQFVLRDRTHTMIGTAIDAPTGRNTLELIHVGNLLVEYCQSDSARRGRVAREIQRRADHISAREVH